MSKQVDTEKVKKQKQLQLQLRVRKYSEIDKVVHYINTRPEVFFNIQTDQSPKDGYFIETLKKLYHTCTSQINQQLIKEIVSKVSNDKISNDKKQQLSNITKELGQQITPYKGVAKEDCVPPQIAENKTITDYVNINKVLNFLSSSPDNRAYFISTIDVNKEDKTKYILGRFVLYVYYYYGNEKFVNIIQQNIIPKLNIIQKLNPNDTNVAKIVSEMTLYSGISKDMMIINLSKKYKTILDEILDECKTLNTYIPNQDLLDNIPPPTTSSDSLPEDPFQDSIPENTFQESTSVTNECDDTQSFPQKLKTMSFDDYSLNKSSRNQFTLNRKEYLRLALLCHPDKTNGSGYPMQVLGAIKINDDIPTKPTNGGKRRQKSKKYGKSIRKSTRRRR